MREIERRVGMDWLGGGAGGGAVVWDGGMGSAIWCVGYAGVVVLDD